MLHLRKSKIKIKHLLVYTVAMVFLMVLLPLISIKVFPGLLPGDEPAPYTKDLPKNVEIYITKEDRYETISFEQYIQGVVASEMPSSFKSEALKAQAVASRTYALGKLLAGSKLCDSVHCQAYRCDSISAKVKRAVKDTEGQVLLYQGELAAHALYFASSGGDTENSQDVFVSAKPYLVSVASSFEPGATHKEEKLSLTLSDFASKLKEAFPSSDFGTIKKSAIKIRSHTKGGRVETVQIGRKTLSGSDIRSALGLYSSRFTISFKGNKILFTTSGSGHGVGMSQYGAEGFARKGKTYRQILAHYYRGTKVSR